MKEDNWSYEVEKKGQEIKNMNKKNEEVYLKRINARSVTY